MAFPSLNWEYVTDPKDPKFIVKGTRIAQAVYGFRSRFAIVEIRTLEGVCYGIADAEAAGDAWYAEGKAAPLLPKRYDDPAECMALIDRWSEKEAARLAEDD